MGRLLGKSVAVLGLALGVLAGVASADDDSMTRATLGGIDSMGIAVIINSDRVSRADSAAIVADIEVVLRSAGIRVIHGLQAIMISGQAAFWFEIQAQRPPSRSEDVLRLSARFVQNLSLARKPNVKLQSDTWRIDTMGLADLNTRDGITHLREKVRELTNLFVIAYLDANPRRVR